ncbi:MAG: hypothetical protein R3Y13_01410 [bacterium]
MIKIKKIIIMIFLLCSISIFYFIDVTQSIEYKRVNEIEHFIESYESINNNNNGSNQYLELDLNENAEVYISDISEVKKIIEKEDAIIYFGFETCPWCRNMIGTLLDVAEKNDKKIYYVDIKSIRNEYTVEDGKIIESKKSSNEYYEVLEILEDYLTDYIIYDEGKEYNTNTKRIYGPTVLVVKQGSVRDIKTGTLAEVDDPYIELTKEQYDLLYSEFDSMLKNGK